MLLRKESYITLLKGAIVVLAEGYKACLYFGLVLSLLLGEP